MQPSRARAQTSNDANWANAPHPPSLSQLYILSTTLAYSITWFVPLADELATLSYYCIVGYRFRPMEANMYLKVGEVRYFCAARACAHPCV